MNVEEARESFKNQIANGEFRLPGTLLGRRRRLGVDLATAPDFTVLSVLMRQAPNHVIQSGIRRPGER